MRQRLPLLLLGLAAILIAVALWNPPPPETSEQSGLPTPAAEAEEGGQLEGLEPPEESLRLDELLVTREELENAALRVEVLKADGTTPADSFDLFLVDHEEGVYCLSDRSGTVGLTDVSGIRYACARDESGWSLVTPLPTEEEGGAEETPTAEGNEPSRDNEDAGKLLLVLEETSFAYRVRALTADRRAAVGAHMELEAERGLAQVFLKSRLGQKEQTGNADGTLQQAGLPAALYRAKLKLAGHVPAKLEIDLRSESQEDLEVVFEVASLASGKVQHLGRGLEDATVALLPTDFDEGIFGLSLDNFRSVGEIPDGIPSHHRTTTDGDGRFRFSTAAPGSYRLLVAATNFLPRTVEGPFVLEAGIESPLGEVEMEVGFGLALQVEDPEAQALAGADVIWYRKAGNTIVEARRRRTLDSQQTDAEGRLDLGGLPGEVLTLEISHPDYALQVLDHDFSGRKDFEVDELRVTLLPGATVAGSVIDGITGMPIEGAELELHTTENSEAFGALIRGADWNSTSGQDGSFGFSRLPAGEYLLLARHEEFAESQYGPIEVTEAAVENLTVILHPGATLLVEVQDSEGIPIAGATVQAVNVELQQVASEETDEEGRATMNNLSAGNYQVACTDLSSFDTSSNEGSLAVKFKFLELKEGETKEVILGGLIPNADVEGVVRRGSEVLAGAMVIVITDDGVKTDSTDELGNYALKEVPLGSYILMVRNGMPLSGGAVHYEDLRLDVEGAVHHDISLPDAGLEVAVFTASDRTPLEGIPVSVRPMDGSNISGGDFGITDAEGMARFQSLPDGDYIVAAGNATASFLATTEAGHGSMQKSRVQVREGSGQQRIEMPLETGATFKVKVEDPDGNILQGAHMHYLNVEGQPLNILSFSGTNSKGVAQMKGLPSGPGIILVRHPILGSKEIEVNLQPGEEAKQVVRLERGTVIYVAVTDSDKGSMSGVLATALDSRGAPLSYLWSQEETRETNAAFFGSGEQKLGPLPDGEYIIQLFRPGNPPVQHPVTVSGQGEMHLSLPYSVEER